MLLLPVGPLGDPATMAGLLQDLEQLAARSGTGCHECTAPETVGAVGGVLLSLPAPSGAEARERGAQEETLVEAVASFARQAHAAVLAHSASYAYRTHAQRPRPPVLSVTTGCACGWAVWRARGRRVAGPPRWDSCTSSGSMYSHQPASVEAARCSTLVRVCIHA